MKKLQYNSPVILTFFLLSLGVLLLDWITGGWTTLHAFCVYRSSLADPLFYVRLFGHVLGHADFDHFLGNMLLLLVIGPPLEEKYGSRTLLAGILLTAGVSGILQCVFFPGSALLGASGIVFMLIMLASLAGMKDGRIPLTLILAAVLYLLADPLSGGERRLLQADPQAAQLAAQWQSDAVRVFFHPAVSAASLPRPSSPASRPVRACAHSKSWQSILTVMASM